MAQYSEDRMNITKAPRLLRAVGLMVSASLMAAGTAHAESCQPIQFERGHDSATVSGSAAPDARLCYTLATDAGQRASLSVEGRNMMFSIVDVVDAQDRYSFTTEKKTYRILVSQLLRAVDDEAFTLTVSVR